MNRSYSILSSRSYGILSTRSYGILSTRFSRADAQSPMVELLLDDRQKPPPEVRAVPADS
jgi:hypothetical protein